MTSIPMMVGPLEGAMAGRFPSDLEADHAGHDEGADGHPDHSAAARDHQPLVDEEVLHVRAVDEPDQSEDDERQRADDIGRCLRFRRHGPDLELHLRALPQHLGEVGQRLGEVAAGLALDRQRDDEELEFGGAEPVRGFLQRGLHRPPDLHLVGDGAELAPHRLLDLVGDDADRLGDRQAGAQAAHHQLDRVREPRGELGDPALDQLADDEVRQPKPGQQADGNRQRHRHALEQEQQQDGHAEAGGGHGILAERPGAAGLLQPLAKQRRIGNEPLGEALDAILPVGEDPLELGLGGDLGRLAVALAHALEPLRRYLVRRRTGDGEQDEQQRAEQSGRHQHHHRTGHHASLVPSAARSGRQAAWAGASLGFLANALKLILPSSEPPAGLAVTSPSSSDAACSSVRVSSCSSGCDSFDDLVALASGWPSLAACIAALASSGMTMSILRSIECSKSLRLTSWTFDITLLATTMTRAWPALALSQESRRIASRVAARVKSTTTMTTLTSLTRCGNWMARPRGMSTTVPSKAWRISSCSWKKAEPSVSADWFSGASADRTQSLSFARTIARSMNRPSMRLGFSIASVRPRPGSRSSASAPVPKWTSRSSKAVERAPLSPISQASDEATVEAPTPPRTPMMAQLTLGFSLAASLTRGPEMVSWAFAKASRSWSAVNGLSR